MVDLKIQKILLPFGSLLLVNLIGLSLAALPECKNLKEDLPDGVYEHALSMRKDLSVLGVALDELLPLGHSFDVETVMTKARNLLLNYDWDKVNSRHYLDRISTKEYKNEQGELLIGAINLFHSMMASLYKCDYTSSLSLAANYIAAFENELYATDDDRVKWTILKVVHLHRKRCLPTYLEDFRSGRADFDMDLMRKIDTIFDADLVASILMNKDVSDVSSVDLNDRLLQKRAELFDRVQLLAKDIEEAKYISAKRSGVGRHDFEVHPDFKRKTLTKHMIEPCRKFVRQFRDIFYPFRLDMVLLKGSSIEPIQDYPIENDPIQDKEFLNSWTKYRVCRELSNDRARFVDLVSGELPYKLGLITLEEPTTAISPTTAS